MNAIDTLFRSSLSVSWCLVLVGFISGALMGLFFYKTEWFGGYNEFPRRILRLGHIACFGLPILNTLLILMFLVLGVSAHSVYWGVLLWIIGQIAMPAICFASAFKSFFRFLFFIPVSTLIVGTLFILWRLIYA